MRPAHALPHRSRRHGLRAALIALLSMGLVVGTAVSAVALMPPGTSSTANTGRFGLPFDIDPYGQPQRQLLAQKDSADSYSVSMLERIASQPVASWFGHLGTASVEAGVRQRVEHARKNGTVAVLVAYNIPFRDCGLYAAGQLTTGTQYKQWIRGFVRGLGKQKAVVVVEPDALSRVTCLTTAQRLQRYRLIRYAVDLLHKQGSWAYIDAGHSKWRSVKVISNRLRAAGITHAAGFSLNVSNYRPDDELIAYANKISARTRGAHYVIDSSRNAVTPASSQWCNPTGMGLGTKPTASTGVPRLDAYLWVKTPGSSDGPCNGGPAAGAWFESSAISLAANSSDDAVVSTPAETEPATPAPAG